MMILREDYRRDGEFRMQKSDIFITPHVKEYLYRLCSENLSVITAPVGYGKTTMVHAAMMLVPKAEKHWFTADKSYSFYNNELYHWFVDTVQDIDPVCYNALQQQSTFNRANNYAIQRIIRKMACEQEQFIIIDNLQYINDDFAEALIAALSQNECEHIHLIILTQFLSSKRITLLDTTEYFSVRATDLTMDQDSIVEYAHEQKVELSEEQSMELLRFSEGWIVIVILSVKRMQSEGTEENSNLETLLYNTCWENLNEEEHKLMLFFSIWQTMEESCFAYLFQNNYVNLTKEQVRELLVKNPLIRRNDGQSSRTVHNILWDFLKEQFLELTITEQRKYMRIAAYYEKQHAHYRKAVEYYYKSGDYEGLLSCKNSNLLLEEMDGVTYTQIALDVARNCPSQILTQFPLNALRYCYALYASAKFAEYNTFLYKLKDLFTESNRDLYGEWLLTSAFEKFPHIQEMTEIYKEAEQYLTHPSEIFCAEEPFMFGGTSMWYLFYTEVGKAEVFCDQMDEMIHIYNHLTNGHGSGAENIYRGEVYCVQGRFEEAELLALQAGKQAEEVRNVSITYGSALLLGIIAIYNDDMKALENAVHYLETKAIAYSFMQNTAMNKYMVDTVRGYLLGLLMEPQETGEWVQKEQTEGNGLTFTNFMVKTTQITDLMLRKEYKKAIANVEYCLTLDKRLVSLPTQNFMHVGLALCYLAIGNVVKASKNLERSLTLAEKDENFTFLACFKKYLAPLMLLPNVRSGHQDAITKIKALKMNYTIVKKKALLDFLLKEEMDTKELSERESEVAKLAAAGMRNKEIAAKLNISEYTVKNHLSVIYEKLKIDRRSRLIEMLK